MAKVKNKMREGKGRTWRRRRRRRRDGDMGETRRISSGERREWGKKNNVVQSL